MNYYNNEEYLYKILNQSSSSNNNSNNHNSSSSISGSNDKSDLNQLFYKVWRNQYLNYQIFKQLNIFKMVNSFSKNSRFTFNLKTLCNFKLKEYLLDVHLSNSCIVNKPKYQLKTLYKEDDIGYYYKEINELFPWCIPQTVEILKLDLNIELIKSGTIPSSIKSLTIDSDNELEVGSIPSNVKKLIFRNQFNNNGIQITPGLIPDSVEKLFVYSVNINQRFDPLVIPSSVKTLVFSKLDHPLVKSSIPSSVTSLELSFEHQHEIGAIPSSVTSLTINNGIEFLTSDSIPNSVKHLVFEVFDNSILPESCIPPSVEYLKLSDAFNHPISSNIFKDFNNSKLSSIIFGSRFNSVIVPNTFPSSLRYIKFGFHYNMQIEESVIPEGVECIEFNYRYNKNICNLPSTLKKLVLGYCFDQPIQAKTLPTNLKHLELGYSFNNKLSSSILPESLDTLIVSKNYTHSIDNITTIANFIQSK